MLFCSDQSDSSLPLISFKSIDHAPASESVSLDPAVKLEPGLPRDSHKLPDSDSGAFLIQLPNPLQLLSHSAASAAPDLNSPLTKADREKAALEARGVLLNREVEAPFEEKRPHSIKHLSSGCVGRFVRYASGRTKLIIGTFCSFKFIMRVILR